MPFNVQKRGDSYVVVKSSTGEVIAGNKTKLSKARAEATMRARYAHSKD